MREDDFQTRQQHATVGCLVASILLATGAAVGMLFIAVSSIPRPPDYQVLQRDGDDIVRHLETYKARHGTYPPDLPTAGITPVTEDYGGWQYESIRDGADFSLSIGRSAEDGFVYIYTRTGWYRGSSS